MIVARPDMIELGIYVVVLAVVQDVVREVGQIDRPASSILRKWSAERVVPVYLGDLPARTFAQEHHTTGTVLVHEIGPGPGGRDDLERHRSFRAVDVAAHSS